MKKIITCVLAMLGLTTACGQKPVTSESYEVDVFKTKSGTMLASVQPSVSRLDRRSIHM